MSPMACNCDEYVCPCHEKLKAVQAELQRIVACASHVGLGQTVDEICDGLTRQHDRIVKLQDQIEGHVERIAVQSEFMSRMAERDALSR
jgi:hypothetical protein